MKPGAKLAAFALVLAAAFGGGLGLGSAFAPSSSGPDLMSNDMPGMDMTHQSPAPTPEP